MQPSSVFGKILSAVILLSSLAAAAILLLPQFAESLNPILRQYFAPAVIVIDIILVFFFVMTGKKIKNYHIFLGMPLLIIWVLYISMSKIDFALFSFWFGLYFVFKSFSLLLETFFSKDPSDLGGGLRQILGIKNPYGEHLIPSLITIGILMIPILFRFTAGPVSEEFIKEWMILLFLFLSLLSVVYKSGYGKNS